MLDKADIGSSPFCEYMLDKADIGSSPFCEYMLDKADIGSVSSVISEREKERTVADNNNDIEEKWLTDLDLSIVHNVK